VVLLAGKTAQLLLLAADGGVESEDPKFPVVLHMRYGETTPGETVKPVAGKLTKPVAMADVLIVVK
jgi:hypothetical protein